MPLRPTLSPSLSSLPSPPHRNSSLPHHRRAAACSPAPSSSTSPPRQAPQPRPPWQAPPPRLLLRRRRRAAPPVPSPPPLLQRNLRRRSFQPACRRSSLGAHRRSFQPARRRFSLGARHRSFQPARRRFSLGARLRSFWSPAAAPSSLPVTTSPWAPLLPGCSSRVTCLLLPHSTFLCFGMAAPRPVGRLISHVILDLDGTLLNTDSIVSRVVKPFLVKNGKSWDSRKAYKLVGKTPYEAAAVILEDYGLPYSTEEFLSMVTPMFSEQWCNIKPLPGANRLIKHLRSNGVPTALASNSPRSNIEAKISFHQGWKESFSAIVGGDEVEKGKPSPDIFLDAAKRMSTNPSNCLVIEDSLPGVAAGKAAGMHVIAIPSVPKKTAEFSSADEVVNSLLDVRPEKWGLPPFDDWIEGTLPIEPWFISGPVIKGFGRGSKILGIPTANLPAESFSDLVSEHTSGVYFGWAGLSTRGIYKMVMSIGWNPYFDNTEKTVEPWLLHDFSDDFYGEELRLAITGYIRPEANFPSLESLIERIHEDGRIAEKALDLPVYAKYKESPYLKKPLQHAHSADGQDDLNSKCGSRAL